jgi:hypothetical protein
MPQIKMFFDGPQNRRARDAAMAASYASFSASLAKSNSKNTNLRANMIDRVHFAKPGCSACGKKVM